jgi:hypothetical protein
MPTAFSPGAFGALEPDFPGTASKIAVLRFPMTEPPLGKKGLITARQPAGGFRQYGLYDIETDSEVYRQGSPRWRQLFARNRRRPGAVVAEKSGQLLKDGNS